MLSYQAIVSLLVVMPIAGFASFLQLEPIKEANRTEHEVIKDCNGILYRFMAHQSTPTFPSFACNIKQIVIRCFEKNKGEGKLLDADRFLLLQSAIVDRTLMCQALQYQQLRNSLQSSATAMALATKYDMEPHASSEPEPCAVKIHKKCEKEIFEEVVVNHVPWPKTTKWRDCYNEALQNTTCMAPILAAYATLQANFGEGLRQREYSLGLFGIFMNDNNNS